MEGGSPGIYDRAKRSQAGWAAGTALRAVVGVAAGGAIILSLNSRGLWPQCQCRRGGQGPDWAISAGCHEFWSSDSYLSCPQRACRRMAGAEGKTPWPAIAVGGSSRVNDAFVDEKSSPRAFDGYPSGCVDRFHTGDGGVSCNLLDGQNNSTIHWYDDARPKPHVIISRLKQS